MPTASNLPCYNQSIILTHLGTCLGASCKKYECSLIQIPVLIHIVRKDTASECAGDASTAIGGGYLLESILVLQFKESSDSEAASSIKNRYRFKLPLCNV